MTKKDFIVIAAALRIASKEIPSKASEIVINEFCYQLEKQNPRFDAVKFKQFINQ